MGIRRMCHGHKNNENDKNQNKNFNPNIKHRNQEKIIKGFKIKT
jgi:hypothetical protein